MKQIVKQKMIEYLSAFNDNKYLDILATLERGDISGDFYIDNNDIIIHLKSWKECYFNLTCEENIKFLCGLIKNIEIIATELNNTTFRSFKEDFYENPIFIESFGEQNKCFINKKYGLFNKKKHNIVLPEKDKIREITVDDSDIVEKFAKENEEYFPTNELLDYMESINKYKSKNHKIYSYFRNGIMAAFVTLGYKAPKFVNIGYIFTSPKFRQNGIAVNLAKYYINEFIDNDVFISYGTAQNENSQKTALSAGFELFSEMYCCNIVQIGEKLLEKWKSEYCAKP